MVGSLLLWPTTVLTFIEHILFHILCVALFGGVVTYCEVAFWQQIILILWLMLRCGDQYSYIRDSSSVTDCNLIIRGVSRVKFLLTEAAHWILCIKEISLKLSTDDWRLLIHPSMIACSVVISSHFRTLPEKNVFRVLVISTAEMLVLPLWPMTW